MPKSFWQTNPAEHSLSKEQPSVFFVGLQAANTHKAQHKVYVVFMATPGIAL
jgi:hypothetical protein